MNKAKMTFRFDEHKPDRTLSEQSLEGAGLVAEPIHMNTQAQSTYRSSLIDLRPHVDPMEGFGDPFHEHSQDGFTPLTLISDSDHTVQYDEEEGVNPAWIEPTLWNESITTPEMVYPPPSRSSWWKIVGSVTGAVVTGLLFGFVVLSLFNKEVGLPIPGIPVVKQDGIDQGDALPVFQQQGDITSPTNEVKRYVQVIIPDQTYYFLQYGVFSNPDGVTIAKEQLQASGVAAAIDTLDEKRVYAGVTTDREQAKLLSSQLKAVGVELIIHEISFPLSTEIQFGSDSKVLNQYLEQSSELVKKLSDLSTSLLIETSTERRGSEVEGVQEQHQRWTENLGLLNSGLPTELQATVDQMNKSMNSALESLTQYNKNGSSAHLWEIQTAMMQYIMLEQQLLQANN